jgi:Flp pilus assembly protein TadD
MEENRFTFAGTVVTKPDQWTALLLTGHNFVRQGRLQDATKIFEGLAVIDTQNPYIQGILGSIYQKQEKYPLALIRYNRALALYPNDVQALANRGEIQLKLGNFEKAAEDLKRAIELDPGKKHPAANRARLLVAIVKEAIVAVERDGMAGLQQLGKKQSR